MYQRAFLRMTHRLNKAILGEKKAERNLVNKSALAVKPKTPYIKWANSLSNDEIWATLEQFGKEPTVYLVDEIYDITGATELIERLYSLIFEHELSTWYSNEDYWPQERNHDKFLEWFEVEVLSIVLYLSSAATNSDEI